MNRDVSSLSALQRPTRVRYGVLGFACALSMITYLDRVCFATVAPHIEREFALSKQQVGWLFTAFAFAYALFEVPSGWMGDVFGPRRTLIRIVLWWSLFTALTGTISPYPGWPWFAFAAMFLVRFLFGMGEAGAYPNIARSFHSWFPFEERGFAQGTVWMAGRFAGGMSSFAVLALMIHTVTPQGESVVHWRHSFWIFGALGLVWCVVFWWWFRDRPDQHPGVNAAELALIRGESAPAGSVAKSTGIIPEAAKTGILTEPPLQGELDPFTAEEELLAQEGESHANVPWGRLLTSGNLWSLCLMYFCASYGWYFNITWLPKYLGTKYGVTQETHGFWTMSLLSGAPLLLGSLACLFGGLMTDAFIRRTGNRKWGRRLFGAGARRLRHLLFPEPVRLVAVDVRTGDRPGRVLERPDDGGGMGQLYRHRPALLRHRFRLHEHDRQPGRGRRRHHDRLGARSLRAARLDGQLPCLRRRLRPRHAPVAALRRHQARRVRIVRTTIYDSRSANSLSAVLSSRTVSTGSPR